MERKTESIFTLTPCFDGYLEETLDGEIRLADYYPDAQEILKTEVIAQITSKKAVGDKIHVDGNGLFRVYYSSSEGDRLGSVSLQVPFSKTFDAKKALPSDSKTEAAAVIQYKNARLVNSRKIEVKASVGLSVKVMSKTANEYLVPADGECEYEMSSVSVGDFVGCGVREQRINEEFALPDGKPPVGIIVRSGSYAKISDIKAITNKAVIKGEAVLTVLYLDESGGPERLEYSVPVTQIVEVEGISESTRLRAALTVTEHKVEPVTTGSGETTAVRFEALVSAELEGYERRQIDICTDAYYISCGTEIKRGDIVSKELTDILNLNKAFRETLEYSSGEVTKIYDVWGTLGAADSEKTDFGWRVNASMCITVLAFDGDGRLCSVDSEVPVSVDVHTPGDAGYTVTPRLTLTDIGYTLTGDSLIEVRGDIAAEVAVYRQTTVTAVTDIALTDASEKAPALPFSVYFAESGEKLWDIAKSHNAKVSDIMRDNGIAGDRVEENRILKIFS